MDAPLASLDCGRLSGSRSRVVPAPRLEQVETGRPEARLRPEGLELVLDLLPRCVTDGQRPTQPRDLLGLRDQARTNPAPEGVHSRARAVSVGVRQDQVLQASLELGDLSVALLDHARQRFPRVLRRREPVIGLLQELLAPRDLVGEVRVARHRLTEAPLLELERLLQQRDSFLVLRVLRIQRLSGDLRRGASIARLRLDVGPVEMIGDTTSQLHRAREATLHEKSRLPEPGVSEGHAEVSEGLSREPRPIGRHFGGSAVSFRGAADAFFVLIAALAIGCGRDKAPTSAEAPPGFWFGEGTNETGMLGGLPYANGYEADDGGWTGLRLPEGAPLPIGLPALFSSGHEPAAFVLRQDGSIRARWSLDAAGESAAVMPPFEHPSQRAWRALLPLPDGGLLAIHEGLCLVRLDARSRIVWSGAPRAHHDVCLIDDERVCVLDRERRPRIDDGASAHPAPHLSEDGLRVVSLATGETLRRISIIDALADSRWSSILTEAWPGSGVVEIGDGTGAIEFGLDPLHANGVELDPEAEGEVAIVFLRDVGALARVDLVSGELLSFELGPWIGAHDPQPVPGRSGWTALFDNHGPRDVTPPRSRVVLTDGRHTEEFGVRSGSFRSKVCGSLAALEGGGWLVTSTTEGRALAFGPDGSLAWEFRTPFRVEEEGLIAALLDMRPLRPTAPR